MWKEAKWRQRNAKICIVALKPIAAEGGAVHLVLGILRQGFWPFAADSLGHLAEVLQSNFVYAAIRVEVSFFCRSRKQTPSATRTEVLEQQTPTSCAVSLPHFISLSLYLSLSTFIHFLAFFIKWVGLVVNLHVHKV